MQALCARWVGLPAAEARFVRRHEVPMSTILLIALLAIFLLTGFHWLLALNNLSPEGSKRFLRDPFIFPRPHWYTPLPSFGDRTLFTEPGWRYRNRAVWSTGALLLLFFALMVKTCVGALVPSN